MINKRPPESEREAKHRQASEQLLALLKSKLGDFLITAETNLGDAVVRIDAKRVLEFFRLLKLDSQLNFNYLVSLTAVDWLDKQSERFEIVYHVMNLAKGYRLRVKAWVSESNPEVESVVGLWSAANFLEREVWDMYGIRFRNHPDLRRILMYDEFVGHPLRKDYPVQGKQPRVPLRNPEVRNTAVDMKRDALVQIGRRASATSSSSSRTSVK